MVGERRRVDAVVRAVLTRLPAARRRRAIRGLRRGGRLSRGGSGAGRRRDSDRNGRIRRRRRRTRRSLLLRGGVRAVGRSAIRARGARKSGRDDEVLPSAGRCPAAWPARVSVCVAIRALPAARAGDLRHRERRAVRPERGGSNGRDLAEEAAGGRLWHRLEGASRIL